MSVQVKGSGTIGGLDEGLVVSGIITSSTQLNVGSNIKLGNAGIVTASGLDISGDIDVDGHTNLDNVSIAGVTTFSTSPVATNGRYYSGIINSGSQQKIIGGYISGSDTLRLGESMYLTSTGLGIKDTNPSYTLSIKDTGHVRTEIQSTDNNTAGIFLRVNNGGSDTGNSTIRVDSSGNLQFYTGTSSGTERLRIDSSGRVLIGTTTEGASGADQLTVASSSHGGITIRSGSTSNGNLMFSDGTSGAAEYAGFVQYEHDNNKLNIGVNGSTKLGITSDGRTFINTTAVTNTNDTLTVKRAAGSFTEMSMTVDANTATGTHANAFVFTKSKNTYWNGLGFQSSHGHIGAIVGMRDSTAMNTSHKIRIEIGGTGINASEEKTWDFLNTGDLSISDGNLVVASGHGIDFSATGGGSNTSNESELFDDYEEGSCAVLIHDAAGSNISVTNNTFKYTKIGNRVFIAGSFVFAETGSKNGGLMILYQLPFVPAQNLQATGTYWYDGTSDGADVTGVIYVSTNSSGQGYLKQSTTIGQPSNNKYLTFNEIQKNSSRPLYASFSYNVS